MNRARPFGVRPAVAVAIAKARRKAGLSQDRLANRLNRCQSYDTSGPQDHRPITEELIHLKQAIDLLKVAEDLGHPGNIERYPGAIASVIRTARTIVEEAVEALITYFAKMVSDKPR